MAKDKATGRPWTVVDDGERCHLQACNTRIASSPKFEVVTNPQRIRNEFALIEKAVNAHDDLIAALKEARDKLQPLVSGLGAEDQTELSSAMASIAGEAVDLINAALRARQGSEQ